MRKHFLILMLFALLPLAGWAADLKDYQVTVQNVYYGVTTDPTVTIDGLTQGNQYEVYKEDSKIVYYSDANCTTKVQVGDVNATIAQLVIGDYYIKVVGKSEGYFNTWNSGKFKVNPRPLSDGITIANITGTFTYNGNAHTPAIAADAVKQGSVTLKKDVDYTYAYSDNIDAGTAKVTFTGKGNFTGTVVKNFTINPKDLPAYSADAYKFTKAASYTYNGQKQAPEFQIFDGTKDITEYVDVKWFTTAPNAETAATAAVDNIGFGTYYAKLFGKKNYAGGVFKNDVWTFSIAKRDGQIIIEKDSKVYDGVEVTNANLDQTKIIYVNFAAADGQAMATNFNNEVSLEFAPEAGTVKNAAKYAVIAKLKDGAVSSIAKNYNITWTAPAYYTQGELKTIATEIGTLTVNSSTLNEKQAAAINAVNHTDYGTSTVLTAEIKSAFNNVVGSWSASSTTATTYVKNPNAPAILGEYEITKRPVTVTLEDIHLTRGDAKLTAASGKSGAAQTLVVDPKDGEEDTDYNVVIEAATATSESGIISGDNVNDFITGLTLKLLKSEAGYAAATEYANAIELTWNNASANAVAKNYVVNEAKAVKGKLIVDKEKLMVYVKNLTREYGYTINQADFSYYASTNLKATPTYKIFDSENNEVTAADKLEAGKTYTITIDASNLEALTPDNYSLDESCIVPNYLNITKKKLAVTVNDLILNKGFAKDNLKDYASVKPYSVAFDEKPTFEFSWGTGADETTNKVWFDDEDKLVVHDDGDDDTNDKVITKAIVVSLVDVAEDEEGYNPVNANYELVPTYGTLNILDADVLVLAANDENMSQKLAAANGQVRDVILQGHAVLKRETWAGMVLPFEISVKELSEALDYAVVDILDEDNTTNDMHLKLHMGKIAANQPFIVKYYKEDEPVVYYTRAECDAYNITLPTARKTTDVKTPAVLEVKYTKGEVYDAQQAWTALDADDNLTGAVLPILNAVAAPTVYTDSQKKSDVAAGDVTNFEGLEGVNESNDPSTAVKTQGAAAVNYTQEECNDYNYNLDGARKTTDVKTAAVDNSELDLATVIFHDKSVKYVANADNVNTDGNVFVQNENNGHQFIGVYNPVEVYGANYKWIASGNGTLKDGSKYTEAKKALMNRLVSYFKLNPSAQNARILIDEPDGTTTVINAITAESMNVQAEGWYTLNGVKLQGVPTQKGIYINNGKKVVIK